VEPQQEQNNGYRIEHGTHRLAVGLTIPSRRGFSRELQRFAARVPGGEPVLYGTSQVPCDAPGNLLEFWENLRPPSVRQRTLS
jgi:hypothetical protein